MIQKKSLKDAIQNPEIISVVGELIGLKNYVRMHKYPTSTIRKDWCFLGRFSNASKSLSVVLRIYGSNGYNAQPNQNMFAVVYIKHSWDASTVPSKRFGTYVELHELGITLFDDIKIIATSEASCEVYIKFSGYMSNDIEAIRGSYSVEGNGSMNWEHNGTLVDTVPSTGTEQPVTIRRVVVEEI